MNAHIATPLFAPLPHKAFQVLDDKQLEALRKKLAQEEEESEEEKEKAIRCKGCGCKITTAEKRIEMNGRHKHIFNNPAGYVFEIGCFSSAEGCANQGMPTMEFTWFPGFAWRFALCGNCHMHLGWLYQSGGGNSFYGLVLDNLVEDL